MKNNINEQDLLKLIKNSLDDSVQQLDTGISKRLSQSRQAALLPAARRNHKLQWTGAVAVSVLLILVFWHGDPEPVLQDDGLIADELALTEDSQDLLMNLDFYSWLESSQSQG